MPGLDAGLYDAQNVRKMSDLYIELRSRIPIVAARTRLGTARIQDAQNAVGLSNEAVARLVPVSEKTWRRWKSDGEVPTYALPAVATALRLELRELQPVNGHTNGTATPQPALDQILQTLDDQTSALGEQAASIQRLASAIGELREGVSAIREQLVPERRVPVRRRNSG